MKNVNLILLLFVTFGCGYQSTNLSKDPEYLSGLKLQTEYETKADVFLRCYDGMTYIKCSLSVPSDIGIAGSLGHVPCTILEYQTGKCEHRDAKFVVDIIPAGTRFMVTKIYLKSRNFVDNATLLYYSEIMSGEYSGKTVNTVELVRSKEGFIEGF